MSSTTPQPSFRKAIIAQGVGIVVRHNLDVTHEEVRSRLGVSDVSHDVAHMLEVGILREEPGGRLYANR